MDRTLERAWERMEQGKEKILARVVAHPPELRDRRPAEGRWSLAEVVEHLVLSEGGMTSALAKGPSPDRPRLVKAGRWVRVLGLRAVLLGGMRLRAPVPAILPVRELPWPELVTRWDGQRGVLRSWLEGLEPRILGDPRFKHPIIGWLDVPQALQFAGDHLRHHLMQVGRTERDLRRTKGI